jgi:hypothetical protein
MPLNPTPVFEARLAAKYTGQNANDFNAAISDFTIVSQNAQGLTFNSGGQQFQVANNGYIVYYQGEVTEVFQNLQDYQQAYGELTSELGLNHVHDLTTSVGRAIV